MTRKLVRCNRYFVPKPGEQPKRDPQCELAYGHDGPHKYDGQLQAPKEQS